MKTCTHTNCTYPVWGKGYCKSHQGDRTDKKPKPPKQRKRIPRMSKKLAKKTDTYRELRLEFLDRPENMFCAVYPHLKATEIHHPFGRLGDHLNATHEWIAVSREGHMKIENEPSWAKEFGFSGSRLKLITPLNEDT